MPAATPAPNPRPTCRANPFNNSTPKALNGQSQGFAARAANPSSVASAFPNPAKGCTQFAQSRLNSFRVRPAGGGTTQGSPAGRRTLGFTVCTSHFFVCCVCVVDRLVVNF